MAEAGADQGLAAGEEAFGLAVERCVQFGYLASFADTDITPRGKDGLALFCLQFALTDF